MYRIRSIYSFVLFMFVAVTLTACVSTAPEPIDDPVAGSDQNDGFMRGDAAVESVEILLLESFPVQVHVQVNGVLPDGCTTLEPATVERQDNTFTIRLTTRRAAEDICTDALVPFTETIPLDVAGLPAGLYTVFVNDVRAAFEFSVDNVQPEPDIAAAPPPEIEPAAASARDDLARRLNIPVEEIEVLASKPVEWPDGCLGLAAADEICTQQVTPGYRLELAAENRVYTYRSDESGGVLRQEVTLANAEPPPEQQKSTCTNRISFVRDVTARDNAKIQPGETFVKTWRLLNSGTCTWTPEYALVFERGDQMSGPDIVSFPAEVPRNHTVDVSATLTAPLERGTYQGFWKLRAPDGELFGLSSRGGRAFWVLINVPATITPTPDPRGSSIRGRAWHDLCANSAVVESGPPAGCVENAAGEFEANGLFETGEPIIPGIEVTLGPGPCPTQVTDSTIADANGQYAFTNLEAGAYCVSIDPLSEHNLPIFIPGLWTYPPGNQGAQTVTVDGESDQTAVDFGWDYQFAP